MRGGKERAVSQMTTGCVLSSQRGGAAICGDEEGKGGVDLGAFRSSLWGQIIVRNY